MNINEIRRESFENEIQSRMGVGLSTYESRMDWIKGQRQSCGFGYREERLQRDWAIWQAAFGSARISLRKRSDYEYSDFVQAAEEVGIEVIK